MALRGRILIVTAVEAERDAAVRHLGPTSPLTVGGVDGVCVETGAGQVHAFSGGVGPVAAAITATRLLDAAPGYEAVISAGIGGGFSGRADVGSVVVADRTTFADLGARTEDAFLTLEEMSLRQPTSYRLDVDTFARRLVGAGSGGSGVAVVTGEILTLAAMTATQADAAALASRFPNARAEAMEGFGVVEAALSQPRVPSYITEIRAISNAIGPRDPSVWQLPAAFDALAHALAALLEEPFT